MTQTFRWLLAVTILGGLYGGTYLQGQQPPALIYGVTAGGVPRPVLVGSDGSLGISASFAGAVAGDKTNNGAVPGANNIGVLSVLANAVAPTWTEGRLVTLSTDLNGALRVSGGGGGTQYTQDAALTVASSVGTIAMGRASAAVPAGVSADDDAVIPWYLRSGAQAIQITYGGVLAATGNGVAGTGVPRVAIASDSSGLNTLGSTTSGQSGIMALGAVTTAAPSYTTAQTNALSLTTQGSLRVDVMNGGAGGLTVADNATFTDNTSSLTPGGGVAEFASPTVCTEGKYCAAATTLNRAVKVTLYDTSGVAITPSQDITHDVAVSASGPQGMLSGFSTIPTAVTTGHAVRAWAGLNGQQAVMLVDASGNILTPSTDYLHDAALTPSTTTGSMRMGRASAAAPTGVSADDDAVMAWFLRSGAQVVQPTYAGVLASTGLGAAGTGTPRVVDVASGTTAAAPPAAAAYIGGLKSGATGGLLGGVTVCDQDQSVNISTATTTLMLDGISGRKIRICAFHVYTTGANNLNFIEGTGATCATGISGMTGGTTAASGYNFLANQGVSSGSGIGEVLTTATAGNSVCIITSAAVQVSGHIKYATY